MTTQQTGSAAREKAQQKARENEDARGKPLAGGPTDTSTRS